MTEVIDLTQTPEPIEQETAGLKRPHIDVSSDDDRKSPKTRRSQYKSTPPPKKRWSGLNPLTPTISDTNIDGLRTPPDTQSIPTNTLSNSLSPGEHQVHQPVVLIKARNNEEKSPPSQFTSMIESDDESKYCPSSSDESEEEYRIPPLSPLPSTTPSPSPVHSSTSIQSAYPTSSPETSDEDYSPSNASQDELPLLGFRGYSEASHGINGPLGFLAGAFADFKQVPLCPDVRSRYYIDQATRHVAKDPRPTCFISLTINPIRAIIRAFGVGGRRYVNPKLAILNLHTLRDAGSLQVAKNLELHHEKKYDSRGELLIWGSIHKDAIISTIDIAHMLNHPPTIQLDQDLFAFKIIKRTYRGYYTRIEMYRKRIALSNASGIAIGQFLILLQLPVPFHYQAVSVIIRDWAFRLKSNEDWQTNEEFCNGIEEGLRRGVPDFQADPPRQFPPKEAKYKHAVQAQIEPKSKKINAVQAQQTTGEEVRVQEATTIATNDHIDTHQEQTASMNQPPPLPDHMDIDIEDPDPYNAQHNADALFDDLPRAYEQEMSPYEPLGRTLETRESRLDIPITLEVKILLDIHKSM